MSPLELAKKGSEPAQSSGRKADKTPAAGVISRDPFPASRKIYVEGTQKVGTRQMGKLIADVIDSGVV